MGYIVGPCIPTEGNPSVLWDRSRDSFLVKTGRRPRRPPNTLPNAHRVPHHVLQAALLAVAAAHDGGDHAAAEEDLQPAKGWGEATAGRLHLFVFAISRKYAKSAADVLRWGGIPPAEDHHTTRRWWWSDTAPKTT